MKTDTGQKIVDFITVNKKARVYDLALHLKISTVAIHKQIRRLLTEGKIEKVGKAPLVFYQLPTGKKGFVVQEEIPQSLKYEIDKNYLYISPTGELLYGVEGFTRWIIHTKQEKKLVFLAREYVEYRKKLYSSFKRDWIIDATKKLKQTFDKVWIDGLYYLDFYSLPKFGKTKLGQLVLYAKQSQNIALIQKIVEVGERFIKKLINQKQIDAIAFIPHTIPRKIQFLKEFERDLLLQLPKIDIVKAYKGNVYVAQKSLARLEDRIINAKETIFVTKIARSYRNILLIDDAAGSGASMNETAKKMKEGRIAKGAVYGVVIVGSLKGFDVISEV